MGAVGRSHPLSRTGRNASVDRMSNAVLRVEVKSVIPTSGGCAVFLGNDDKVFVIYVDQGVGAAIAMFLSDAPKERPLTHDLTAHLLAALGAKVERTVINDLKSSTYFARLIVSAQNEIMREKKIIEVDARPSDSIALALQQHAPIYVSEAVWEEVEDMSEHLRKMEEAGEGPLEEI